MTRFRNILIMLGLGAVMVLGIALLVSEVRHEWSPPPGHTFELAKWLLAVAMVIGSAYAMQTSIKAAVDELQEMVPVGSFVRTVTERLGRRTGDTIIQTPVVTPPVPIVATTFVVERRVGQNGDVVHIVPGATTEPVITDDESDE